jgi:hypothetical protein
MNRTLCSGRGSGGRAKLSPPASGNLMSATIRVGA